MTTPVLGFHLRDDTATTLFWNDGQAAPTLTATIYPGSTQTSQKATDDPGLLSPGIIGAIVVVLGLVVICMATAAALHRSWCMNPRCKVCLIFRCGRRKSRKGWIWDRQPSNLPTFSESFDKVSDTPEKTGFNALERSPLDRQFRPYSEGGSTLVTKPRLQKVGDNKPRYFDVHSIVSDIASVTAPHPDSTAVSTPLEPTTSSELETVENPGEGESHPPPAFDTTGFDTARSRSSQTSGLLSIITLPSFITNDRPRTYSSSAGMQMESSVQPRHRRHSSLFGQRFSGIDVVQPASPINGEDMNCKRSRPMSSALQNIASVLKRSDSTSSSVKSATPSRRSRRFPGRPNLSLGTGDEAVIEWKRLPPLPSAQGTPTTQTPQSYRAVGVEDLPREGLPSGYGGEPESPFLAPHVPLPPSPSTLASSASSLAYAPPSPVEIPPINGFTTSYTSYPPLPHPLPSTSRPFGYLLAPHSAEDFTAAHMIPTADSTVSTEINTLHHLPGSVGWARSDSITSTTATLPAFSGNDDSLLPYSPNDDGAGRSIYRESTVSAYSQYSTAQELALPLPSFTSPSSPSRPLSPRGPRPLPVTGQPSGSGMAYSQVDSTGKRLERW